MLRKGRVLLGLVAICLLANYALGWVGDAHSDTYSNNFTTSFDFFDTDAWHSARYDIDFTYDPSWNLQPVFNGESGAVIECGGVMDQGTTITIKPDTSTLAGDAIRCNWLSFGRYFFDHYGDGRITDMNIVIGEEANYDQLDPNFWIWVTPNRFEVGREGWGWAYVTDSQVKFDLGLVRYCTETPKQPDYNDPNNTSDPTTWTLPWPAFYTTNGPFMKFMGNTTVTQYEPGFGVWLSMCSLKASDSWPAEPQKGGIILSGSNINFHISNGSELRLFNKAYIRYEVAVGGGYSTIHMANNADKLNGASAGGCVSVVFLGAPPVAQTTYHLVDGITADGAFPIILDPNMDPNLWTLARVADKLDATYTPSTPAAAVVAHKIFYNNSSWDGVSDDNAIATDKSVYLHGSGAATFANYITYSKGINGLMIDISNMAAQPVIGDVTTKVGNNNNPGGWAAGPAPTSVTTVVGGGTAGSNRVKIIFADNAIADSKWVQVTLNKVNVGLAADDVFYVGLAIGETSNNPANAIVDAADRLLCRNNPIGLNQALITNVYDFNRDKNVNATDRLICRNNSTNALTALTLINIP